MIHDLLARLWGWVLSWFRPPPPVPNPYPDDPVLVTPSYEMSDEPEHFFPRDLEDDEAEDGN